MKRSILFLLLLLPAWVAHSQYTLSGKIEYERKVNSHAQMEDWGEGNWKETIMSKVPKFSSTYFDLLFDTTTVLYQPGREPETPPVKLWTSNPAAENRVLTNFGTGRAKAMKLVYDDKFVVEDTVRQLDWRLKNEVRTIAGYTCHKAVSRICDSVYVVAFYTEDIPTPGGPELFAGLPGMILELAIPRLHTTWTATKVDLIAPKQQDFKIPEKGKKVTNKELYESVQASLKGWGKSGTRNVWWIVL